MQDLFQLLDCLKTPLRDPQYMQRVALIFSVSMFVPWILLGFDSGVGMLEVWSNNWQIDYSVYGQSFHFSSFIIYGLLFVGFSRHLAKIKVVKSRNVICSLCLVILNIGFFEMIYMALFNHYQIRRSLITWFIEDLWFLQQYILLIVLGVVGFLIFYLESYKNNHRTFSFHISPLTIYVSMWSFLAFIVWVYYPGQTEIQRVGSWISNSLFPQTHYAYFPGALYVENNMLHLWNLITKAAFGFAMLLGIKDFRLTLNDSP